jgi:predicted ATP-dependent serine protease
MTRKILIAGNPSVGKSALMIQSMKEKYGEEIILVTTEEAKEQGLGPEDFLNLPKYKITAPPIMEEPRILGTPPTGKEKRRKRREEERLKRKGK